MGCASSTASSLPVLDVVLVFFDNGIANERRRALFVRTLLDVLATPCTRVTTVEAVQHGGAFPSSAVSGGGASWSSIRLHVSDVMWYKEHLVNLGARAAVSRGAMAIAWVDADVRFENAAWASETLGALHGAALVQPWTTARIDGSSATKAQREGVKSFAAQHARRKPFNPLDNASAEYWHPGFAWAARADFFTAGPGLFTPCLGESDKILAVDAIGARQYAIQGAPVSPAFSAELAAYATRVEAYLKLRGAAAPLAAVAGHIVHGYHGDLATRGYTSRIDILRSARDFGSHYVVVDRRGVPRWRSGVARADFLRAVENWFATREAGDGASKPRGVGATPRPGTQVAARGVAAALPAHGVTFAQAVRLAQSGTYAQAVTYAQLHMLSGTPALHGPGGSGGAVGSPYHRHYHHHHHHHDSGSASTIHAGSGDGGGGSSSGGGGGGGGGCDDGSHHEYRHDGGGTHQDHHHDGGWTHQHHDASGGAQYHDASGGTQYHDVSGGTQYHDASGGAQYHDDSGGAQYHDDSGGAQYHDDSGGTQYQHVDDAWGSAAAGGGGYEPSIPQDNSVSYSTMY